MYVRESGRESEFICQIECKNQCEMQRQHVCQVDCKSVCQVACQRLFESERRDCICKKRPEFCSGRMPESI